MKKIEYINDDIVVNYKQQIEILKSINDDKDKIIKAYEKRETGLESYVELLKDNLAKIRKLYIGII